ncbi:hypothetical protein ACNS7O_11375 [Haloferacaceae archaeon DSL9]
MLRRLLILLGAIEFFAPDALIECYERLAFDDPDAGTLKAWVVPAARIEGLALFLIGTTGRLTEFTYLIAVIGAVAVVAPRALLEWGLRVAYENPDDCDPKPWIVPATRGLGVLYLSTAVGRLRRA